MWKNVFPHPAFCGKLKVLPQPRRRRTLMGGSPRGGMNGEKESSKYGKGGMGKNVSPHAAFGEWLKLLQQHRRRRIIRAASPNRPREAVAASGTGSTTPS